MPVTNLSSVEFNDDEKTQVDASITTLKDVFVGKATNLTGEERRLYGSINEENKLMVQKMLQYIQSNPEIKPPHVDLDELGKDNDSRLQLGNWMPQLKLLLSDMENTKILLDYDVFQSCLTIYRNVRYLAKEDMAGMNAIYNDLKQFFPGGGATPTSETAVDE